MEDRESISQVVRLDCWVGNEAWDIVNFAESNRIFSEDKTIAIHSNKYKNNNNNSNKSNDRVITLYKVGKNGDLIKGENKSKRSNKISQKKKKRDVISSKEIWLKPYGWFYNAGEKIPFVSE